MTPAAFRALFRVVGEDRSFHGQRLLRQYSSEPEIKLDNIREYLLAREWGMRVLEGADMADPARGPIKGHDRDQISGYTKFLEDGRPLEPIVMMEDARVLIGWHRAVAARLTGRKIAAFVPLKVRRKRKGA